MLHPPAVPPCRRSRPGANSVTIGLEGQRRRDHGLRAPPEAEVPELLTVLVRTPGRYDYHS